jgi:hypothetical protein
MKKIDMHVIKPTKDSMLICIGYEDDIIRLKEFNHENSVSKVINFLIENNIYCHVSCEYEGDETKIVSIEELEELDKNELLVNSELAFEAMILTTPDKAYDNLKIMGRTKEEIDNIFQSSWWLDKFDV